MTKKLTLGKRTKELDSETVHSLVNYFVPKYWNVCQHYLNKYQNLSNIDLDDIQDWYMTGVWKGVIVWLEKGFKPEDEFLVKRTIFFALKNNIRSKYEGFDRREKLNFKIKRFSELCDTEKEERILYFEDKDQKSVFDRLLPDEFWKNIKLLLKHKSEMQYLTIYLIHRKNWRQIDVSKYFNISTQLVQHYQKAAYKNLMYSGIMDWLKEGRKISLPKGIRRDVSADVRIPVTYKGKPCTCIEDGCKRTASGNGMCRPCAKRLSRKRKVLKKEDM